MAETQIANMCIKNPSDKSTVNKKKKFKKRKEKKDVYIRLTVRILQKRSQPHLSAQTVTNKFFYTSTRRPQELQTHQEQHQPVNFSDSFQLKSLICHYPSTKNASKPYNYHPLSKSSTCTTWKGPSKSTRITHNHNKSCSKYNAINVPKIPNWNVGSKRGWCPFPIKFVFCLLLLNNFRGLTYLGHKRTLTVRCNICNTHTHIHTNMTCPKRNYNRYWEKLERWEVGNVTFNSV